MVDITNRLLSKLDGVEKCGDGWKAMCPAHHDKRPSLSIGVGKDGLILIHCHAGCSPSAVMRAVGMRMADLYPRRTRRLR